MHATIILWDIDVLSIAAIAISLFNWTEQASLCNPASFPNRPQWAIHIWEEVIHIACNSYQSRAPCCLLTLDYFVTTSSIYCLQLLVSTVSTIRSRLQLSYDHDGKYNFIIISNNNDDGVTVTISIVTSIIISIMPSLLVQANIFVRVWW